MEISHIIAKYKDYVGGEEVVTINRFKSWDEEGSYTVFYGDVSLDSAALVIPTRNVISIDLLRDGTNERIH